MDELDYFTPVMLSLYIWNDWRLSEICFRFVPDLPFEAVFCCCY